MNRLKFLEEHLKIVFKENFKPTEAFNKAYFQSIPHKYYKYRKVNKNNLNALENDYIWLSTADKFFDDFDSILHFNVFKQKNKIYKVYQKEMPRLVYEKLIKELRIKHKVNPTQLKDINYEKVIDFVKELVYKNGSFRYGQMRSMLKQQNIAKKGAELFEKRMRELVDSSKIQKYADDFKNAFSKLNPKIRKINLVHSFAGTVDNEVLWDFYADHEKGFCIEYDISKLEEIGFDKFPNLCYLWPMNYQKNKDIDISELVRIAIRKQIKTRDMNAEYAYGIEIGKQVMTKRPKYSIEDEWRLVLLKKEQKQQAFKFPFTKSIYLGTKISEPNRNILIDIANKKQIYIYQRVVNLLSNSIDLVKLN